MAEMNVNKPARKMTIRHRGRGSQVWIYLGKLLRMFVYQSDWKVLPMAALIAGLVGMVIRRRMFINMEGTLMCSFAMVCVCIWNGCFNSIQVICRERDVIKREHRSGMHVSSYIFSHMLYQALLCLAQTGVTLGKLLSDIAAASEAKPLLETKLVRLTTVGDVLDAIDVAGFMDAYADTEIDGTFTVGEAIDLLAGNGDIQARRDETITVHTTVGKLLDLVGEEKVKTFLEDKAAEASYTAAYEYTRENVMMYWLHLVGFILAFALLATVTLEFIDKDKR